MLAEKDFRMEFSGIQLHSAFELHRRSKRGEIIPRSFYKREESWNQKKKSRLIESLLLGITIPMIYIIERAGGIREVVDGQRRLDAIFDFFDDKYPLIDLSILKNLNGKGFKDFEQEYPNLQRKLEDYDFWMLIIKNEYPMEIGREIFERLNQ